MNHQKGDKLTEEQLLKLIRTATHQPLVTVSKLISNYITWYYKNNSSLKSREQLAEQMRHQPSTAHLNYFKIEPNKNELEELKQKIDIFFNNKENEKLYKKQRRVFYIAY